MKVIAFESEEAEHPKTVPNGPKGSKSLHESRLIDRDLLAMITPRSASAVTTCGFTLLAVALIAATIHLATPDYAGIRAGRVDAGYLESNDCRKCHEGNYATWHATFHRTMTQEANPQSVLGDFERDNTITYQGVRTEMVRENGRYWMKFTGVDGKKQQLEIVRTIGSRRIQQYLTKNGDQWVRLADRLRSCSAPLDASEWIVFLSRRKRLQAARRRMEFELRFLSQRQGPTASGLD